MTRPAFDPTLLDRIAPDPPSDVEWLHRIRRQADALISVACDPTWSPLNSGDAPPAVGVRLAAIAQQIAACRLALLATLDDLEAPPKESGPEHHRPRPR